MGELWEKAEIAERVCLSFGMSLDELSKRGGSKHLYETRRAVVLFMHEMLGFSLNEIADIFGKSNRNICYMIAKGREELNDLAKSSFSYKYEKLADASHKFQ